MSRLPRLDCAGCRTCCLGDTITLRPAENPALYKTKLVDGRHQLAKGKDGNCVYLGKSGCQIYGRQPGMCRDFDCRVYALQVAADPPEKRALLLSTRQTRRSIDEGRRRLGLTPYATTETA